MANKETQSGRHPGEGRGPGTFTPLDSGFRRNDNWKTWLDRISGVEFTLASLLLAMALVVLGTLGQMHMGSFEAQKKFFNSWWIYGELGAWKVPVFPGGLTVGALWFFNLTASFITRFRWRRQDAGIFISHAGLILLLLGQFLTQLLARENNMALQIGQSSHYAESLQATELVLIKTSDPAFDEVTSIPENLYSHEGEIHPKRLPFYLVIHRFFRNAQLGMAPPPEAGGGVAPAGTASLANQGIGSRIAVQEAPPAASDDEANNVTAFIEVREPSRSRGIWLVSTGLGAPQSFNVQGADYQIYIRPKRTYYPFTLTLEQFHHDIYPGTDIPKNFSSLVRLSNPDKNESRETLIYMNHPLRYAGKTFYQASFGEGDKMSVFQVVDNPASVTPYVSCTIVILGLLIQFLSHLIAFARKRHEN